MYQNVYMVISGIMDNFSGLLSAFYRFQTFYDKYIHIYFFLSWGNVVQTTGERSRNAGAHGVATLGRCASPWGHLSCGSAAGPGASVTKGMLFESCLCFSCFGLFSSERN